MNGNNAYNAVLNDYLSLYFWIAYRGVLPFNFDWSIKVYVTLSFEHHPPPFFLTPKMYNEVNERR